MKALIPAAGHGTRFLPVTRVVPKEMLPIGAKPALQLIVEEALAAGADEVVIVISPEKEIIRRYFEGDPELAPRIRWSFQTEQKGLGHAVLQAADVLAGEQEPVLVLLGDALVSGEAPSATMAAISQAYGGASVVGLEEVPLERVSCYGIVKGLNGFNGLNGVNAPNGLKDLDRIVKIEDLVEKPAPDKAPSRLAIAGRYLLDPAIFGLLASQTAGVGGEIQLMDAIRRLLDIKPAYGYRYPGTRHDIGNPAGYLKALQAFASAGST
ncbi:MAG: NTP transferase domain-containing protein [Kiritimatiellae bacterium]|nr:NTP transferase domain-containing protein [Kiritimatiellia bacterium]